LAASPPSRPGVPLSSSLGTARTIQCNPTPASVPPEQEDWLVTYPMFAMVLLTATVLVILFRSRVAAVRQGLVSSAYFSDLPGSFRNLEFRNSLFKPICFS
jgi:hypothetical protein